jgi:hypothetical protein
MSVRRHKAYPENAPGDFYVICDECIICDVPRYYVPDLIGRHDDPSGTGTESHCYFKKQPESTYEVNRAVKAVSFNCCGTYRYAGSDPEIKNKLRDAGCGEAIDNP